jgi:hypothetical protein
MVVEGGGNRALRGVEHYVGHYSSGKVRALFHDDLSNAKLTILQIPP